MDKVTLVHVRLRLTSTGKAIERIDLALTGEVQVDEACAIAADLVGKLTLSEHFAHLTVLRTAFEHGLVTIEADRTNVLVVPKVAAMLATTIVGPHAGLAFESEIAKQYGITRSTNSEPDIDWSGMGAEIKFV